MKETNEANQQQKLKWLQKNKARVSQLAKQIDASIIPHSMTQGEIDLLIKEAKQHARSKNINRKTA